MSVRRLRRLVPAGALLLGLTVTAGCAGDRPEDGDTGTGGPTPGAQAPGQATPTDTSASSPTRVALPGLFSIMTGLQQDMARVSRGLWLEDFDTVAAGAEGVANHPRVPPEEFQVISGVLGQDMSRFAGMDREVHDLAVRLAEEARREDLEAVLVTDAELRRGCVVCHSEFRERLREAIR